ncbi:GAF domain-containing sensor histidine kinase [soil metagenome]
MLHPAQSTTSDDPGILLPIAKRPGRTAIVRTYGVLDTPPEAAFDRITALAADLFDAPTAIIGFVDHDRVWFKSHHGVTATEMSWPPDSALSALEPRMRREFGADFFAGAALRAPDGYDLGSLCVVDRRSRRVDAKQMRHLGMLAATVMDQLETRLANARDLAQAHLMVNEVDHRAMNSLQLVASLLRLQSRAARGAEAAQQLATAANRVLAVARVHRNFAADEVAARVPLLAYLRRLCGELADSLATTIEVDGIEKSIPTAQILAIGLITNELVTNAKKHGAGSIDVTFMSNAAGLYELCVFDEGPGLPEGFAVDRYREGSLGMKVVNTLVAQLRGELSAGPNPTGRGACFTVAFPVD